MPWGERARQAAAFRAAAAAHRPCCHALRAQVDFNAKTEYDYINNYKALQDVFNKLNIDKHIEVQKLVKARPLDNMEFMQWFKSYFDNQTSGQGVPDYDGGARRAVCKSGAGAPAGAQPAACLPALLAAARRC